jgi:multiple sugar transport system ATP-binding protein
MASIVFENIEKWFGAVHAVKGISLEIADHEFVAFLGPSGCGKTTCLRMLAGLDEPSGGRLLLGGEDVTWRSPGARDVAMVFQNYALYPHLSVRENLLMGLKYRGVPRAEFKTRIGEAAALLGIEDLLERRPAQISGGQRQRVALGRAIVRHPKAFLMDEPLSNLDTALRAKMRTELKLLHQRIRTTTIYVTHDQVEAMTMADRIAVMAHGTLMQFDTPERIFNEPANRFVAQFVGAPGINLVPATLRPGTGGATLELLGLEVPCGCAGEIVAGTAGEIRVDVGIRPQALRIGREAGSGGLIFAGGCVSVLEPIGTQTHVHVGLAGHDLVAVVEPRDAPQPGDQVTLTCDPADVYLFDAESGRTLLHGI